TSLGSRLISAASSGVKVGGLGLPFTSARAAVVETARAISRPAAWCGVMAIFSSLQGSSQIAGGGREALGEGHPAPAKEPQVCSGRPEVGTEVSLEVSHNLSPPGKNVSRDMPAPPANGQPRRPCTPAQPFGGLQADWS